MKTLDANIVVIAGGNGGALNGAAAAALSAARALAGTGKIYALVENKELASKCAAYGADYAYVAPLEYGEAAALAAAAAAEASGAALIIAPSSNLTRDIAGRLAVALETAAVVDAQEVTVGGEGEILASKQVLGGRWSTVMSYTSQLPVVTLAPGSYTERELEQAAPVEVLDLAVETTAACEAVRVESSEVSAGENEIPASEAQAVVCGGRGTDGDFEPVRKLAAALGGSVAATRVATEEGWIDQSVQVGQTGLKISPRLYVGLGVSGAIHHVVGMQASEHIVAVCDDPDAPIFDICDFGVVGDLFEVTEGALAALEARN